MPAAAQFPCDPDPGPLFAFAEVPPPTREDIDAELLRSALAELAGVAGVPQPGVLWECELPEGWKLTAHAEETWWPYTGRAGITQDVPPATIWLEYRDWPAGEISRAGTEVLAPLDRPGANLYRAIRDEICRRQRKANAMSI